jgi:hypothetical protein
MKTYGNEDITPSFLTSALDGSEWSASHPSRFTPEKESPVLNGQKAVRASAGVDAVGKRQISRHAGNRARPVAIPTGPSRLPSNNQVTKLSWSFSASWGKSYNRSLQQKLFFSCHSFFSFSFSSTVSVFRRIQSLFFSVSALSTNFSTALFIGTTETL